MSDSLERRRALRKESSDAELLLWKHLRAHRLAELKWRRQHPIGRFFVDFYCHAKKLVIEVDGSQHYKAGGLEYDRLRTAFLEEQGLMVLRFTNVEVLTNTTGVLEAIWRIVGGDEGFRL
jgi:very-short-patch-repair endonuclease